MTYLPATRADVLMRLGRDAEAAAAYAAKGGLRRVETVTDPRVRELVQRQSTRVAGYEWGSGFFINPVPPEDAAERHNKRPIDQR